MWWCSVNLETRGLDLIKRKLWIQYDYTKFEGTAALIPVFSCVIFLKWKRNMFHRHRCWLWFPGCFDQLIPRPSFRSIQTWQVFALSICNRYKRKQSPADNNLLATCAFNYGPRRPRRTRTRPDHLWDANEGIDLSDILTSSHTLSAWL